MTSRLLDLLDSAGPLALLVVMAIVLAETGLLLGVALPGDSLLFGTGLLVASGAIHLPVVLVMASVALAAFAGDQLGYTIGHRYGPRVFSRSSSRMLNPAQVDRAADLVRRYGARGIVLARFVPVVRTIVPLVAGVGSMGRRRFALVNALGALVWGVGVVGAGYMLGGVPFVVAHVELCALAVVLVSLLPMAWHARRARSVAASSGEGAGVDDATRPEVAAQANEGSERLR
ncbi:MAG: hypothetical protein JWN84_1439 [Nocardioides sp.]|jgi:membrane-associated protein|nr:hypothetical protein [Nocardioides sp.]